MEKEQPTHWLPEGENHKMHFNEEGAKVGLTGFIRFFSFTEAVWWDMMLENGYGPTFLDTVSAIGDYRHRISKVMKASVNTTIARDKWYLWHVGEGAFSTRMYVRQGYTETLFRELQYELDGRPPMQWMSPWLEPGLAYGLWTGEGVTRGTWAPWSHISPHQAAPPYPAVPRRLLEDPRVLAWRTELPSPSSGSGAGA